MKAKLYVTHIFPILIIFTYGLVGAQYSPPWEWVKTLSSTGGVYGKSLTVDQGADRSTSIYVAGGFDGTVDFDPSTETFELSSPLGLSAFVSKIDMTGNFLWTKAFQGPGGNAFLGSITTDPINGDIYLRGRFRGTIDFDPNEGIHTITSNTSCPDVTDCGDFIAKLDDDGNFIWVIVYEESQDIFISSIAVDPGGNGDVYITGNFSGIVDFDPGLDTFDLKSIGNNDIFISKLNSSGDFQWAKRIGGQGNDHSYSIAIDPMGTGEVYATGYFTGTVDFNPDTAVNNLHSTIGQSIFISKLDSAGNFIWAKGMGRAGLLSLNQIGNIALDPAGSGDVYTTGSFQGESDFNPGDDTCILETAGFSDIFISKLDNGGNFKWAKAMGGTNQDYGVVVAIDSRGSGNVFMAGRYKGLADFDPGPGTNNLISAGDYDIFIAELDNLGNVQWVKTISGQKEEFISSIALDQESLILSGFFHSSHVSFDSDTISNVYIGADLFVGKLDLQTTSVVKLGTKEHQVQLYPNPASNEITVEFDEDESLNVDIAFFNVLGEVVLSIPGESMAHKKTIDISGLAPGIYFMTADMDGVMVVKKIMKQ